VNFLDYIILGTLAVGIIGGVKLGLIKAVFIAAGIYIGCLFAGQSSRYIGSMLGGSIQNETLLTVVSYFVVIAIVLFITNFAYKFAKPMLSVVTIGISSILDRIGGLALGLIIGLLLSSMVVVGLSRLTYSFDSNAITDNIPGSVVGQVPIQKIDNIKTGLEGKMVDSQFVSAYINSFDKIPVDTLGYVSADFKVAIAFLRRQIEITSGP